MNQNQNGTNRFIFQVVAPHGSRGSQAQRTYTINPNTLFSGIRYGVFDLLLFDEKNNKHAVTVIFNPDNRHWRVSFTEPHDGLSQFVLSVHPIKTNEYSGLLLFEEHISDTAIRYFFVSLMQVTTLSTRTKILELWLRNKIVREALLPCEDKRYWLKLEDSERGVTFSTPYLPSPARLNQAV